MAKAFQFIFQFAVLGLAVAFVVVWFQPQLLPALERPAAPTPTSFAEAVNRTAPSVVSIYTRTLVTQHPGQMANPMLRELYRDRRIVRPRSGLGSGVIISDDGLILTTRHVIAEVDDILVALWDGRVVEAEVVGMDPGTDLALLRIAVDDLPAATLAGNTRLRTGDVVLAIGNAFGLSHTVTMGIVSATGRGDLNLTTYEDFIQTDAAINSGNSGGALINPAGEVVGINSASLSQAMGAQGIGFAIPAHIAREIVDQIIEYGQVRRGWIGAELSDPPLTLQTRAGISSGAQITQIYRDGPAWRAGLRQGDILVRADAEQIINARQLTLQIAQQQPGRELELDVIRSGQSFTTSVVLIQQPPLRS